MNKKDFDEKNRCFIIYKITCIKTKKSYVGQTVSEKGKQQAALEKRWKGHSEGPKRCPALFDDIEKYGKDNFTKEILMKNCKVNEVDTFEGLMIDVEDTLYPKGYNLQSGGVFGYKHHEDTKKKIGEAQQGDKHHQYGKPRTDEEKEKMRVKQKGKIRPNKFKRKNKEHNNLPRGVFYVKDDKGNGNEGYRARRLSDGKSRAFTSSTMTMEEKLRLATLYRQEKINFGKHEKMNVIRKNAKDVNLPKYIKKINTASGSVGFRVVFLPAKKDKTYTDKKKSLKEKLKDALIHLKKCYEDYKKMPLPVELKDIDKLLAEIMKSYEDTTDKDDDKECDKENDDISDIDDIDDKENISDNDINNDINDFNSDNDNDEVIGIDKEGKKIKRV